MEWEQELARALKKEEGLLQGLADCARQKTELLVNGRVDELDRLVGREQSLALELQGAEAARVALLRESGLGTLPLRAVAEKADEPSRPALLEQHRALSELTKRIRERNALNAHLTHARLEFYGKLRALHPVPVYGKSGAAVQGDGRSFINRKI